MVELTVLDVRLHDKSIGTLTQLPGDRILLTFNDDYVADTQRATLSLSLKGAFGGLITDIKPTQTRLPPFFSNLLPEGAMRDYLAARANVNPAREFHLLWILGQDLPGAVKVVPPDGDGLPPETENARKIHANNTGQERLLRFSLAGVQLKFSAVRQAAGGLTIPVEGVGGSSIVKLPSTRYPGVPENEYAMMELARRIGIDIPETQLISLDKIDGLPAGIETAGDSAFVIRRFDRPEAGGSMHIEDFAQVFGLYPGDKYGKASYRNIARVIWIETGEIGTTEFLRRFVFSALIGNGDMHAKNWSLIYPDRRTPQLAPAYDFVSTIGYIANDKLALSFVDSKAFSSLTYERFARFAAKAGLPEKLTIDTVNNTVARFREAWPRSTDLPVAPALRNTINAHLATIPVWQA